MRAKYATDYSTPQSHLRFFCPGCQENHLVRVTGPFAWGFNGNLEKPTITPSVLVRHGHYANNPPVPGNCYCDFHQRHPDEDPMPWTCHRCHSFVSDGRINFLPDCTHALRGWHDLPELSLADAV